VALGELVEVVLVVQPLQLVELVKAQVDSD
jgi:hypothetical protein